MKYFTVDEIRNLARQHTSYLRTYYVEPAEDGHFNLMKRTRHDGDCFYQKPPTFITRSLITGKNEHQMPIHVFPEIAVEFK